jgi:cytochrome c oxidase subunit IV
MAFHTEEEYRQQRRAVWKTTGILAIVTVVEVSLALLYNQYFHGSSYRMALNVFMIVASLAKAFYIIGIFMHVRYENKAMAYSILAPPLMFFIWFIIAFLMEGNAYHHMKELFG